LILYNSRRSSFEFVPICNEINEKWDWDAFSRVKLELIKELIELPQQKLHGKEKNLRFSI
jgi:hypothetical protein